MGVIVASICGLFIATAVGCRTSDQGSVAPMEAPPAVTTPVEVVTQNVDPLAQWGAWRGPAGTGFSKSATPPLTWSPDQHVQWRVPVSGQGHSSPVVWDGVVYLTTAVPHGEALPRRVPERIGAHHNLEPSSRLRFEVWALSLEDGSVRWKRALKDEQPHEGVHETGSWASASCATDGEVLVVPFGSRGLFVLSPQGVPLWDVDLGDMFTKHGHGEGSSPLLVGDLVITQWDHEEGSFLVALDKKSGAEVWRVARQEVTSWASPIAVEVDGVIQVITAATGRVRGQNAKTGAAIWEAGGLSNNVVASPVASNGRVFVGSSYEIRSMFAVSLEGAKGDVSQSEHVLWKRTRDTPYVASPVLEDGRLCFLRHLSAMMTCVDPATGVAQFGPKKLPGLRRVFSSPVGAPGRLYVTSQEGTTVVLGPGPGFELLATNHLKEGATASPALVGDVFVMRTERAVYALREKTTP